MHNPVTTGSNSHRYNHRHNNHNHRILQQISNPKTSTKKKNSKSSTKPQPNRSINDQTQPTIGGESCGGRRAKIGDCSWASRAKIGEQNFRLVSFNRRALLQIGIAFFMTGKKKKKKRERKRRRDGEMER